jgi:hypothetical protein
MRNAMARSRGLLLLLGAGWASAAGAQTVGQTDTFEGTTTQGWIINGAGFGAPPPSVQPTLGTGGPTGQYLLLTSDGSGLSGSRLNVMNGAQWAGNYLTSGIGAIAMDVRNFGQSDLFLRLAFEDPMGAPPNDVAYTTGGVSLPSGSGWMHVLFPILPASLTAGLGTVNAALANTTVLRLYHSPAPNFPNPGPNRIPAITARLGVDNVTALAAVPEPATVTLVGVGVLALAGWRRRRLR